MQRQLDVDIMITGHTHQVNFPSNSSIGLYIYIYIFPLSPFSLSLLCIYPSVCLSSLLYLSTDSFIFGFDPSISNHRILVSLFFFSFSFTFPCTLYQFEAWHSDGKFFVNPGSITGAFSPITRWRPLLLHARLKFSTLNPKLNPPFSLPPFLLPSLLTLPPLSSAVPSFVLMDVQVRHIIHHKYSLPLSLSLSPPSSLFSLPPVSQALSLSPKRATRQLHMSIS